VLTVPLKISHHRVEPINTPKTNIAGETWFQFVLPTPNPAYIAAKERIVIGFVAVKRNVEA